MENTSKHISNGVKEFIEKFDINNPIWTDLPEGFPKCDLDDLSSQEVGKFNSIKTLWELSRPEKPKSRSRVWADPEGYKWLVQWSNLVLLRYLVRLFTDTLPKQEYRRKAQVDDAARSCVRNLEEGYKRATTSEYIDFIGYSQGSLEEVKGDIRESAEDGFLKSKPDSSLASLGIDLGEFNRKLKESRGGHRKLEEAKGELEDNKGKLKEINVGDNKGLPRTTASSVRGRPWDYHPLTILYPPLKNIYTKDLTIEIFMELINKTDYLLRKLVESLERKQSQEKKYYQVEQARIREKFKKK